MATFQKRGSRWRAIIRKTGHPVTQKSFSTKAMAQRWAMETERAIERREWSAPALMRDITLGYMSPNDYEQLLLERKKAA